MLLTTRTSSRAIACAAGALDLGHPKRGELFARRPYRLGIALARSGPIRHAPQLNAPNHRLHFQHAPIGAKALMHPPKTRWMLAFVHRLITLAMVLERPHRPPQRLVIRRHHAALAARGHDLVLAKTPSTYMANAADTAAFVACTMGLGTVFNKRDFMMRAKCRNGFYVGCGTPV
jgi:hypothetical protein